MPIWYQTYNSAHPLPLALLTRVGLSTFLFSPCPRSHRATLALPLPPLPTPSPPAPSPIPGRGGAARFPFSRVAGEGARGWGDARWDAGLGDGGVARTLT